jgi:hypothetical protein
MKYVLMYWAKPQMRFGFDIDDFTGGETWKKEGDPRAGAKLMFYKHFDDVTSALRAMREAPLCDWELWKAEPVKVQSRTTIDGQPMCEWV